MTELPRWGLYGLGISLLIKVIVASNLLGFYGPCPTDGRYRALRLAQRRGRGEDSGRAKTPRWAPWAPRASEGLGWLSDLLGFYGPCPTDGRYRALRFAQRRGRGEDSGRAKAELDFYRHCSAADSHRAVSTRRTMERL
jgi:hypothetical protein